jgi:NAD(P)-dependent dehydrogenase (short-subunit alcohol dehydrogenase family)
MSLHLGKKVALITGGDQGLVAAIARRFAEEGATVFIADITAKGGKAYFLTLDVTKEESWIAARSEVENTAGRFDVLVNNAGINIREPIEEMQAENFDKMLEVNVRAPFLGIKHFIPLLRKSGGGSLRTIP